MPLPVKGTVGIVPAGALGVSFFYHLTNQLQEIDGTIFFLERFGSSSFRGLRAKGELVITDSRLTHHIKSAALLQPALLACYQNGSLPEVLLACPNPDQLLGIISECVGLLEAAYARNELNDLPLPIVVLCSNGIYFQRLRQIYLEKMEEATLLGRLPDLWPDMMPQIVGRLLRGVSIQTGVREGAGPETIYFPGPRAITRIAGGDFANRERSLAVLTGRGGWFELAPNTSATRLEFDKAMVNLSTNLLGQLYAIDDGGRFRPLTVAEIIVPDHHAEIRDLCRHVFEVGKAVRAYGSTEDFETLFERLEATLRMHQAHIPSSLQWVALRLRTRSLEAQLTPTEAWLLEPLIRYALSAGLDDAAHYFEKLKERSLQKLSLLWSAHSQAASNWDI